MCIVPYHDTNRKASLITVPRLRSRRKEFDARQKHKAFPWPPCSYRRASLKTSYPMVTSEVAWK